MPLKIKYFLKKTPSEIKKSLAGFTLVEIVVAAVILSIAIWSIMVAFNAGTRFVYHSRYRLLAVNHMQAVLEDLRQAVREDTWAPGGGDPLDPGGPYNCPGVNPLAAFGGGCQYTVLPVDINSDGIEDVRRVDVTVTWTPP